MAIHTTLLPKYMLSIFPIIKIGLDQPETDCWTKCSLDLHIAPIVITHLNISCFALVVFLLVFTIKRVHVDLAHIQIEKYKSKCVYQPFHRPRWPRRIACTVYLPGVVVVVVHRYFNRATKQNAQKCKCEVEFLWQPDTEAAYYIKNILFRYDIGNSIAYRIVTGGWCCTRKI